MLAALERSAAMLLDGRLERADLAATAARPRPPAAVKEEEEEEAGPIIIIVGA
jgi:hypothetical protein